MWEFTAFFLHRNVRASTRTFTNDQIRLKIKLTKLMKGYHT